MQKKLIALAVAGLASSAVFAQQNNVTIYGIVDVGIDFSKNGHGTQTRLQSGQSAGTRLGFKGEEALGNGLKAVWVLEQGLAIDTASSTTHGTTAGLFGAGGVSVNTGSGANYGSFFNRQSYAGLAGGWGQLTIGKQYAPFWYVKGGADAFNLGLAPTINNIYGNVVGNVDRLDNSLLYISPSFGGFLFALGYSSGNENNVDDYTKKLGRAYGALAMYSNGGLWLGAAYHNARALDAGALGIFDTAKADAWILGGSYDFKVAKVFASYGQGKAKLDGTTALKDRAWSLAASVPFGQHKIMASYGQYKDRMVDDADFDVYGVGYEYAFSKRTSLYAAVGVGDNDTNAAYGLNTATSNGLTNTVPGKKATSVNLGLRHSF